MPYRLFVKYFLYLLFIATPIIVYFTFVIKSSVDFPYEDDYQAILDFLISYNYATTFSSKIELILAQHNEHRIIFGKLITVLYYKLFGSINFVNLIILGNISLLGIWLIVLKSIKIELNNRRLLAFIPVTIFLFNFRYVDVSCWAMASLQNIWVILFAFLSLYFLLNDKKQSISLAVLFATLATFTSGNGLLTFLTGIIMLILRKDSRKVIILFASAFIINIMGFAIGIHKVGHHPSFFDSLISEPSNLFLYPLNFIGSLFDISSNICKYLIGAIILSLFFFIFIKKLYKLNYLLGAFLLFMILTVGIVSVSRFGFGVEQASASRYMINSTLIYIIIGLFFYQQLHVIISERLFTIAFSVIVFISIVFSFNSYKQNFYRFIYAKQEQHNLSLINKGIRAKIDYHFPGIDDTPAEKILIESNKLGIYKINLTNFLTTINIQNYRKDTEHTQYIIDNFRPINDSTYTISGWIFIKNQPSFSSTVYIEIEDSLSNSFIEIPNYSFRSDVTEAYASDNCDYSMSGFYKEIKTSRYPKGSYQLSLLIMSDSISAYKVPINKVLKK
jgi:hypothetical protein